ncbi:MAG: sortase [Patescibacteria group bacterium]
MKKPIYVSIIILGLFAFASCFAFSYYEYIENASLSFENQGAAAIAPMPLPSILMIPKLNLNTKVEFVGVTDDGKMATPDDPANVGWYKFGAVPGAIGSAVIAGHLDQEDGSAAAFANLSRLEVGDEIFVINEKGEKLSFVVTQKKAYDYNDADTSAVFGTSTTPRLNLITCNGTWLSAKGNYAKRLVVFTELKN